MPRGRPRQFDEEEALDAALRLFWRHGYEGTSISSLARAMGMTVPSVYNAFGNKESLFMRAVEYYDRYSARLYEEAFAKTTARDVARSILLGEVDLVSGAGTPEGCLMIQGALATGPNSETVQRAMSELRISAQSEVVERLEELRREGGLPPGWRSEALASFIMTIAGGIAVQAKSGASRQELIDVADMAMKIWPENRSE